MRNPLSTSARFWCAKACAFATVAILLVVMSGCAGAREGNPSVEPEQRTENPPNRDYEELKRQARQVRKEYPKLFDHLVRRDTATTELVQAFVRAIPNPEHLPELRIPFMDSVIEVMAPRDDCPVCDPQNNSLSLLSEDLRALLCHICRTGIYLRGSGIGGLGAE